MDNKHQNNCYTMENDFNLLIKEGNLGFYTRCEITTIFIHNKETKLNSNFYTLAVFEEGEVPENSYSFLSPKLIEIDKYYSMGILRHYEHIENAKKSFLTLLKKNDWTFSGNSLGVSKLRPIPKQFVPVDGTNKIPVNSVLKNNFKNGSYLLEFFDESKGIIAPWQRNVYALNKILSLIKTYIPIDLSYISERIGNIVFQFPVDILAVYKEPLSDYNGLAIEIAWHQRLSQIPNYTILEFGNIDNVIIGFNSVSPTGEYTTNIPTGNIDYLNTNLVYNSDNKLILSYYTSAFLSNIGMSINLDVHEPRWIKTPVSKNSFLSLKKIELKSKGINSRKERTDYISYINTRIYEYEKKVLEQKLKFVQYGKGVNDNEKALSDVQKLIQIYGGDGAYLWDPYLSYIDVLNTLYFTSVYGVELRAIGSYNTQVKTIHAELLIKDEEIEYQDWVKVQRDGFQTCSNNLGINLEFRCQHSNWGWGFHDRFIIFPGKFPKAWSLGTSVNSLGRQHHILMEIQNPRNILEAFEELWSQLDNNQCIVWRSVTK